jgi:hypothetical protein
MAAEALSLTILRQGDMLTMDFTEVDAVVPRHQLQVDVGVLNQIGEQLAKITALANKRAALRIAGAPATLEPADDLHAHLQYVGTQIFYHLFPESARQRLRSAAPTDLFLRLDDQLVQVPWELAFDGEDFLLSKFRIGRQVITGRSRPSPTSLAAPTPLHMLIIADPTENLPAAAEEAAQICELIESSSTLKPTLLIGALWQRSDILRKLNEYELVHYAGHAFFDPEQPQRSGWVLHDGVLTAADLGSVTRPPMLVFSNACQSGATTPWPTAPPHTGDEQQAFGIGSAFLLAGTPNYIGTFYAIHDTHSAAFAAAFYRDLLQGACIGAALATARSQARHEAAQSGLLWASYMHYGNPTSRFPTVTTHSAARSTSRQAPPPPAEADGPLAAPVPPAQYVPPAFWQRRRVWVAGVVVIFAVLLAFFWPASPPDVWTTKPLTLAFIPFEDRLIVPRLAQALQESGRVKIVERERLEKLLAELHLDPKQMDRDTALRIGRILAARLMALGNLLRDSDGGMLSLRLVETETSVDVIMETKTFETPNDLDSVVHDLAQYVLRHIRRLYPLQGRVLDITPQGQLLINIGADQGVTLGLTLHMFGSAEPLPIEKPIGHIKIQEVYAKHAEAAILHADLPVQRGWRVKESE